MQPDLRWHLPSPSAALGRPARVLPAPCRVLEGGIAEYLPERGAACPMGNRNRPWILQRLKGCATFSGCNIGGGVERAQSCFSGDRPRSYSHAGSAIDSRMPWPKVAVTYHRTKVVLCTCLLLRALGNICICRQQAD